jgi:2-polyprenyl-3-methyl-5-hydroxy-6-metoxy-1,4-benzoquinol methylase
MTQTQPEPDWSAIAEWYDGLLRAGSGPHETAIGALLGLTPDLASARVVDVACGQGLASRAIAEAGA